jgi:hypothetical protein
MFEILAIVIPHGTIISQVDLLHSGQHHKTSFELESPSSNRHRKRIIYRSVVPPRSKNPATAGDLK